MRSIELLAPARDLQCGLEAVRHGADAVYIGAERFGARAAAGNSVEDIAQLVAYAHTFGVRIYVTLNTLLHDDELPVAQALIDRLADVGVDALIVQDERIMPHEAYEAHETHEAYEAHEPHKPYEPYEPHKPYEPHEPLLLSRIPLHSSTQMDNRTIDDVQARLRAGYQQTVLARELSLDEIRAIHDAVPAMPLEVFVHGALCVSYSGRCYASEFCFGRSANRGECAQFCRLPFQLTDGDGKSYGEAHWLSLRDMNRSADLEALMDAGVSSFKIEGRLKDVGYVKNVTAFYRQRIDAILARRRADYSRASFGSSAIAFTPAPSRSFNRGFTDYFLHGRTSDLASIDTPKSTGQPVGTVVASRGRQLTVAPTTTFAPGDGLCYFDAGRRLRGFRVNSVEGRDRLLLAEPQTIPSGTPLFRNLDAAFDRQLARPTADRRIAVRWTLTDAPASAVSVPGGFAAEASPSSPDAPAALTLTIADEAGRSLSRTFPLPFQPARQPQRDAICRQLTRLGDTPFACSPADIDIRLAREWFIPASTLAEWRRELTNALSHTPISSVDGGSAAVGPTLPITKTSSRFLAPGATPPPLMTCRYCIRHLLGACSKEQTQTRRPLREPLSLRLADGRTFPLHFDCRRCEMQVLRP